MMPQLRNKLKWQNTSTMAVFGPIEDKLLKGHLRHSSADATLKKYHLARPSNDQALPLSSFALALASTTSTR
jgi:hypothetical protein